MAVNKNKRLAIKHFRDGAKNRYPKKECCAICSTTEELELHHYNGLQNLLDKWQKQTGISLDTDSEVLAVRDEFIAEHEYELFVAVVCLCGKHHKSLHRVYGISPLLSTAKKQEHWVEIQKEKHNGMERLEPPELDTKIKSSTRCNSPSRGWFSGFNDNSIGIGFFQQAGISK